MNRYKVHPDEDYQPGSTEVLKNHLDTFDPLVIAQAETEALQVTYEYYVQNLNNEDPITPKLIQEMHQRWLGHIYLFDGKYRSVSMSKGGFPFAAPGNIDSVNEQIWQ